MRPPMHIPSRWLPFLLLLLAAFPLLPAQSGVLTVSAAFEPPQAKPGAEVVLVLTAKTTPGFHAYGTRETTNVPVSLSAASIEADGLEIVGAAAIPPGERKRTFGVETWPLPEQFQVRQRLRVPAGFARPTATVRGLLDYQLCDENSCLPPDQAAFSAVLRIDGIAAPQAQEPPPTKPGLRLDPDALLTVAARVRPAAARAGEQVTLVLEAVVADGFHVYGSKESIGIPVSLPAKKLQAAGLEPAGEAVVPPGTPKETFGVVGHVLPQRFEVTQALHVPEGTAPGTVVIRGVLDYAACDDNGCRPPAEAPFEATIVIEAGPPRAGHAATAPGPRATDPIRGSWWQLILACIGGGLFALVMPCTYPMIPITFSFFTKQADQRGGRVLTLALAYGAGIVGMFTLIGMLAGAIGERIVPFAAHWATNVVIGTAFLLFGLSLVGLFTLQPPRFLVDAAGRSRGVGGLLGVLLMGATLVISSFTCTAPVVALLLLPAVQSGDSLRPTVGMGVFGLTMALPFVLLALLPGRVRALPRSGEWMNTLKVSLGVVELAAALKFFSNAEYVVELYILPRELFFGIWIALFAGLAVYLWGLWPRAAIGNGRRVGGLASLAFAGYCLYGALGYPLDFVMTALAPAYGARDVTRHVVVVDDYEAAASRARAQGKLVLVNLSGFTCTNCRMVERGILPDDAIAPILAEHFVEARLHMDNEAAIPPEKWRRHVQLRQDLVEGRLTTPTYVTVDPSTGAPIVEHVLSGGPGAWLAGYRAFLERTLAATGRPLPGAR